MRLYRSVPPPDECPRRGETAPPERFCASWFSLHATQWSDGRDVSGNGVVVERNHASPPVRAVDGKFVAGVEVLNVCVAVVTDRDSRAVGPQCGGAADQYWNSGLID